MPPSVWRTSVNLAEVISGGRFGTGGGGGGGGGGGAGGGGGGATSIEALPEMPSTVASTLPLPAVEPAVKTVEPPEVGATVPRLEGITDHAAPATETALPYPSTTEAVNGCEPPS